MEFLNPEEFFQRVVAHADHVEMSEDERRHSILRALETLDDEQLARVNNIMGSIAHAGTDAAAIANFYHGILATLRYMKFGTCMSCGVNHDTELAEVATEQQ